MSTGGHKVSDSSSQRSSMRNPNEIFSPSILNLESPKRTPHNRRRVKFAVWILAAVAVFFLFASIVLAILVGIKFSEKKADEKKDEVLEWPEPTGSLYGRFKRAAIATDHGACSTIGRQILIEGGNAVEATIASLLCVGAINPQSSGLGGGFFMTIYNSTTKSCTVIDSRETAPSASTEEMFLGDPQASLVGYRSIATPGELAGFWTAFQRFGSGRVRWYDLFQPTIALCLGGFPVSSDLAKVLLDKSSAILEEPSMSEIFVNKTTGQVYQEGDIITRPELGRTLQRLANSTNPVELFYQGEIARTIANEMQAKAGLVTYEDLRSYRAAVRESPLVNDHLPDNLAICGPPPPSSFAVTQSIIAVMGAFYADAPDKHNLVDDPLMYHRLIEAMKFAYAERTLLGDSDFVSGADVLAKNMTTPEFTEWVRSRITDRAEDLTHYGGVTLAPPEDHGTSHTSTLDAEGNAVSCTSTVNRWFGSMRRSPELGIIWNDQMDDFSTPGQVNSFGFEPSKTNFIAPGKRPMSSMSPAVIYDTETGKVKLVVGASGGSMIISAAAQTAIRALWLNQTIKQAVDWPRLHNQFLPHNTDYEATFPPEMIVGLSARGQNMTKVEQLANVVQAIIVAEDGFIYGNSDFRRKTATFPSGF